MADDRDGLFSEQAAALYGSDFYWDVQGREVEVTCLGVDAADYNWPDKIVLGRLYGWIRCGRPNTVPLTPLPEELLAKYPMLTRTETPPGIRYHAVVVFPQKL